MTLGVVRQSLTEPVLKLLLKWKGVNNQVVSLNRSRGNARCSSFAPSSLILVPLMSVICSFQVILKRSGPSFSRGKVHLGVILPYAWTRGYRLAQTRSY